MTPRYHFDTDDGERFVRDGDGLERAGPEAARAAAVAVLPALARDALARDAPPDGGSGRRAFTVEVRDAGGRRVLKATLALVVERLT